MSGDSVDSELERADTIVSSSQNGVESLQSDISDGNADFKSFR